MRNEYKELLKYSKIIEINKSNHVLNYYNWTLHITEGELIPSLITSKFLS